MASDSRDNGGRLVLRVLSVLRLCSAMSICIALSLTSSADSQSAEEADPQIQLSELERLRDVLNSSLETSGAYDTELLQPMSNLTEALISVEGYEEANALRTDSLKRETRPNDSWSLVSLSKSSEGFMIWGNCSSSLKNNSSTA